MGISLDASTPARWAGVPTAGGASLNSASFTAPANSFLVLCINMDGTSSQASAAPTVADSGSLTWTKQKEILWGTTLNGGYSAIWTAIQTTSAARTVNISNPGANQNLRTSGKVYVFTGVDIAGTPVDTTGTNNAGASATNNLTTSSVTPGADGVLVVCDTEWNELGVETSSDLNIGFDTADYAGQISVASGAKACSNGVAVTGNLNAGGTAAAQHKWTQIVVRAAAVAANPEGWEDGDSLMLRMMRAENRFVIPY